MIQLHHMQGVRLLEGRGSFTTENFPVMYTPLVSGDDVIGGCGSEAPPSLSFISSVQSVEVKI